MTTTTSYRWCHALATTTTIASATAKNENNDDRRGGGGRGRRSEGRTYNYFAFGSNMAYSTMTDLRGVRPLNSSAAVLPGHVLRFNVPGLPLVEPSSASVEPVAGAGGGAGGAPSAADADAAVHGVLYELSESDFGTICRTEGVPFVYALHRCRVYPYAGDGGSAGEDALRRSTDAADEDAAERTRGGVSAFTLRASREGWRTGGDTPPSLSYLNVLLRGAREFALDDEYLRRLENIRGGKTLFGDGVAGGVLRLAEERRGEGRRQARRTRWRAMAGIW